MRRFAIALAGIMWVAMLQAQKETKITRQEYIDTYKELAMEEMRRSGIPASITLAQGLLESGNGNSSLAVKGNNHFGIKCHNWTGATMRHNDDARNECFRKYKSAEQSYIDHSDFLTSTKRYAELFELPPDDYKAWAKGLKKTGYATSPTYDKALITIIEENTLYEYDKLVLSSSGKKDKKSTIDTGKLHEVHYNNRVKYIVAGQGDTWYSLTQELNLFDWQLPKYNECSIDDSVSIGQRVYLQPKRNRSYGNTKSHIVKEGETVYSISQEYAIKEQKLRDRNNLLNGAEPAPGTLLLLNKKSSVSSQPKAEIIPEISNEEVEKEKKTQPFQREDSTEFKIEYDLDSD